ncbi:MAG: xanthine dehydrogenase family protein subunit M [Spirochaeta sp.]|nr:xanthine dehydrogenase family protein subunit M [Spirochaeta sp.]
MSDSRVLSYNFDYFEPATLETALDLIKKKGSRIIAGGSDLLVQMKTGNVQPQALVNILGLKELDFISLDGKGNGEGNGKGLEIGAAAQLYKIEENDRIKNHYTALFEAVKCLGSTQIRNMATMAGNICNASPGADTLPPLIVFGAEAVIRKLNGQGAIAERRVAAANFCTAPGTTVLTEGEMVTAIVIPPPGEGSGSAFKRLSRVTLDLAKISCALYLERRGETCTAVRVAIGAAAPTVIRARLVEEALAGKKISKKLLSESAALVTGNISPITDIRSTGQYRNQVAPVLIADTFEQAWQRSGGKVLS